MASAAVYVAMHKPYQVPGDAVYIPIQVGAAGRESFLAVRDDLGENISEKNASFCELTGLYWLWKHGDADVLGLAHYRRHFASGCWKRNPWKRVISGEEILSRMENVDLLLPKKRHYIIETNYSQYIHAHHEEDLRLTRQVLSERCPDYLESFDLVMGQRSGHRFNMLIARREVLDRYCQWLFPILFTLEQRIDLSGYDAYNRRVFGFLAERLLDVWVHREQVSYRELPVVNMEGENWIRKGTRFCLRKFGYSFQ